jgi:Domain of unknown function (DUF3850)
VVEHELKTWPAYFDAVKRGEKKFEVRRDDRGFQKGDVLILQRTYNGRNGLHEVDTDAHGRPKHELRRKVTYILTGGQLGIEPGYVVLGLADLET